MSNSVTDKAAGAMHDPGLWHISAYTSRNSVDCARTTAAIETIAFRHCPRRPIDLFEDIAQNGLIDILAILHQNDGGDGAGNFCKFFENIRGSALVGKHVGFEFQ